MRIFFIIMYLMFGIQSFADCAPGMFYSKSYSTNNAYCHCPIGQEQKFSLTGGTNAYFGQCNYINPIVRYPLVLRDSSNSFVSPRVWLDASDPFANGVVPAPGAVIKHWRYKNNTASYASFTPLATFLYDYRYNQQHLTTPAIQLTSSGIDWGNSFTNAYNIFTSGGSGNWSYTFFVVFRKTTDVSTSYNLLNCYTFSSGIWNRVLLGVNTSNRLYFTTAGQSYTPRSITSTSFINTGTMANYATIRSTAGSNIQMWLNGASQGTTSPDQDSENCYFMMVSGYPPYWSGSISEIIEYSVALSDLQITQVHNYIKRKWGF